MLGYSISRKDDLESLFYTIVHLLGLPIRSLVDLDLQKIIK